jgi:crossover junction endodeoxyribonuclease RuvC
MRVLAVDPGLTRCGLAVVDGHAGRRVSMVAVDVITTPAHAGLAQRLLSLEQAFEGWLEQVSPDVVAVERVFSQHNVRTVMGTAQAAGIAVLVAARHDLPVALHTPSEVKAAVTGSGRAGKAQVATMITRILGLAERPHPADASDALALAICHLWRGDAASADTLPSARPGAAGLTAAQRAWIEAADTTAVAARRTAARTTATQTTAARTTATRTTAARTTATRSTSAQSAARRARPDRLPG